jgi:hypothetical protein
MMRCILAFFGLLAVGSFLNAGERERVVESVLPSLDYGPSCWSTVNVQNLGDRAASVALESHRASGALVALEGIPHMALHLNPGERSSFRLEIKDETGEAWVKLRETIPAPQLSPVVALSGVTECVAADQLRSTAREVAFPIRNPWFSGEAAQMRGNLISLVNTSERPARALLCYSSGNLYSVPSPGRSTPELMPICSTVDIQVPPFASLQFPVEHEGSSQFSIKTRGDGIVLQMLRPLETGVKMYKVDSTIKFGGEAETHK